THLGTGTARAATSIACEARERGLSAEWQTAPNTLFSCINSVIAIHRKPHTVLRRLAVQLRTVFGDAPCLKLSVDGYICGRVPPGQKSYCLVQDFIAAFAFVMLAFQRLDACGAKRVMPTATLARFNPSHYHSHFRFYIYGMALAVCFQDA
ncbi:MAG: hypothetical protein ACFN4D_10010, partial [Cardiobacterium sp.]